MTKAQAERIIRQHAVDDALGFTERNTSEVGYLPSQAWVKAIWTPYLTDANGKIQEALAVLGADDARVVYGLALMQTVKVINGSNS